MLKCADTTAYSSHNRVDEAHDLELKFAGIESDSEGCCKNMRSRSRRRRLCIETMLISKVVQWFEEDATVDRTKTLMITHVLN